MSHNYLDGAPSSKPTRKDALRNRQLLIQSAREVFAVRGLDASMDDVAHHAGLGVGTAYRHFANKHELAGAIFDDAINEIAEIAEEASAADDPWEGLVVFLEAMLNAATLNRAVREILTGRYGDDRDRHHARVAGYLTELIDRAQVAGAVRMDAQYSDFAFLVVMLCTVAGATAEQSPYLWRRYLPIMLAGMRPDGAPMPMPVPPLTNDQVALALSKVRPVRVRADADSVNSFGPQPAS